MVLTPHYYFIPTVYITRCVLACLVEVLTTRLSRIIQSGLEDVVGDEKKEERENDLETPPKKAREEVIVPPESFPIPSSPKVEKIKPHDIVAKVAHSDNPPVEDDNTERVPTVAEFTPERSNTSFSQKGYYGPYHCLRLGCGYVCDKFGRPTQKLLLNHWTQEHGDIRTLLMVTASSLWRSLPLDYRG